MKIRASMLVTDFCNKKICHQIQIEFMWPTFIGCELKRFVEFQLFYLIITGW